MFAEKPQIAKPLAKPVATASFRIVATLTVVLSGVFGLGSGLGTCSSCHAQTNPPMVAQYLYSGKLAEGNLALRKHIDSNPTDDQARFGLGMLEFMEAVEHFGQQLYSYGRPSGPADTFVPFLRLPVPMNDHPQPVSYDDLRMALQAILLKVNEAEKTLANIESDDVKMTIDLRQVSLDYNADGKISEHENFAGPILMMFGGFPNDLKLVVDFDKADVVWLRGYCNLVAAMAEALLAVDMQDLWDVIAHRWFPKAEIKHDFLRQNKEQSGFLGDDNFFLDIIAAIHNMNFEVIEPERLRKSHAHLKKMVELSRKNWEYSLAESDDEREWIPNPRQTGFVSAVTVSKEMVDQWHEFLIEWDALLDGKKLAPFWRGVNPKQGVNVKRVFFESRRFDLVLWIHGSAAAPYLEVGDVTQQETWERFQSTFGGQFLGFAAWFN